MRIIDCRADCFQAIVRSSKSGMHWGDGKMFFTASVGAEKSMSLGAGSNLNTPKMNASLGFGVGRELNEKLALGLDYVFTPNHKAKSKNFTANIGGTDYNLTSHGKLNSHALFITGRYNIAGNERFTPFVKLGAGMARNSMLYSVTPTSSESSDAAMAANINTKNPRKYSTHFAWQIGGGVDMKMNEKISAILSYAYMDKGNLKMASDYYFNSNSQSRYEGGSKNIKLKNTMHNLLFSIKFSI